MGCVAGTIIYFIRGMWFAPKRERLMGGIQLLKKRAPILGGIIFLIKVVLRYGLGCFQ